MINIYDLRADATSLWATTDRAQKKVKYTNNKQQRGNKKSHLNNNSLYKTVTARENL
jgi:hypothetical protein